MADRLQSSGRRPKPEALPGLRAWFWSSISVAVVAGCATIALVTASLIWEWVGDRIGSVPTALGALVVATLASAGAARTLQAQSALAERNRREDIESALWERYDAAAKQLSSDQGFAVQSAGVYALAGLANDWIRHHDRMEMLGDVNRKKNNEVDTIVSILCAQLRKNSLTDRSLTRSQRAEDALVSEAIISRLQVEFQHGSPIGGRGSWVGKTRLDLREVDLSGALLAGVDFTGAVLKRANLRDADFTGAILDSADLTGADVTMAHFTKASMCRTIVHIVIEDEKTRWPTDYVRNTGTDGFTRLVPRAQQSGLSE
ncbi:pentapeptide repeat-containing protein [Mycobacteroides abscessus]|uniref:pentapeptide repeat-containing protein n=1 Tax=Mycobacteroides abscessus TaxID=36809 RepID=UPI000C267535|nr:pentapeptide repeat-containing protein [Mycobacteroides abscessus]